MLHAFECPLHGRAVFILHLATQAITIRGPGEVPLYSKLMRLFDRKLRLKRGLQRVEAVPVGVDMHRYKPRLVPSRATDADESVVEHDTVISVERSLQDEEDSALFASMPAGGDDEYFRLLKLKEACVPL